MDHEQLVAVETIYGGKRINTVRVHVFGRGQLDGTISETKIAADYILQSRRTVL